MRKKSCNHVKQARKNIQESKKENSGRDERHARPANKGQHS